MLVRPRFEPATSRTAVRCSTNWANRSVRSVSISDLNISRFVNLSHCGTVHFLKCVKAWLFIIRRPPAKNWIWCNYFLYKMAYCSYLLGIKRNFTCLTNGSGFQCHVTFLDWWRHNVCFWKWGMFALRILKFFGLSCLESLLNCKPAF